ELAKNLKTPEDLSQFDRLLKKLSVEAALNAEMTHHLEYEKNQSRPGANSRNGYSTKTVITGDGPQELRTPRDRDGTFEPQLVKKNQTRITGMDNQILSLYAKGMTTREIAAAFKELYDADVSPALNRPGFPGECFICELRLPDHRFRWKHNKLFLLLPEE
ncbi:transposase, partial [Escherichia coli]|uniref:transposase n=1 Tax=Escherichia coli TaxID=562 RepID=UPI00301B9C45